MDNITAETINPIDIKDLPDIDKYIKPNMSTEDIWNICLRLYKNKKYTQYVRKLASRYIGIDPALDMDDLLSQSYIIIHTAIKNYRLNSNMKFSTYLWWELQKGFSEQYGKSIETTIVVEIYDKNNNYVQTVSQKEFEKIKRHLPCGYTYISKKITKDIELKRREEER